MTSTRGEFQGASLPVGMPARFRGRRTASIDAVSFSAARGKRFVLIGLLGALMGCTTLGPTHRPPESPLRAPAFANTLPAHADAAPARPAASTDAPMPVRWWEGFQDAGMTALVARALESSPTAAQAAARVAQARAALVVAGAQAAPQLGALANASRSPQIRFTPAGIALVPATILQAGLDASWEFDLFGRIARGREAAQSQAEGTEADAAQARATLAAEVVRLAVQVRGCVARLDLLERQRASAREALRLDELRLRAGRVASADVAQTRATVADIEARAADARAQCGATEAALAEVLAQPVPELRETLRGVPGTVPVFAAGAAQPVPADLLRARPDILAAERRVAAASARIGEAEAARWPSLSLTGALSANRIRAAGTEFDYLSWSIAPGLRLPLLDGNRRQAQVDQRVAEHREALEAWRAQVLRAATEAETALAALAASEDRLRAARDAREQFRLAFVAQDARVKAGRSDTLELERARRQLVQAEAAELDAQERLALDWVAFHKAMGAGWGSERG